MIAYEPGQIRPGRLRGVPIRAMLRLGRPQNLQERGSGAGSSRDERPTSLGASAPRLVSTPVRQAGTPVTPAFASGWHQRRLSTTLRGGCGGPRSVGLHQVGALLARHEREEVQLQVRRLEARPREEVGAGERRSDPAVGAALRLMHASPDEPWSVERLARAVSLSRSAFAARFTERVGEAPLQYLPRWRMTLAAERLRDSDDSVLAIAATVGYRNPAAFRKAFSRTRGTGPGAYRRAHRRHSTELAGRL